MRILVVDDHQLVIDGLSFVLPKLGNNVRVESETSALAALKRLNGSNDYDLILFDLSMPDMDGLSFLTALREHKLLCPAVAVSATDDLSLIQSVLDSGAQGFIPKAHDAKHMLDALSAVLNGEIYIPKELVSRLAHHRLQSQEQHNDKEQLLEQIGITRRQYEVLMLLAKGCSNKEVGGILGLTEHTVKSHVSALFKALKADNRTECVRNAYEKGMISSPA